MARRPLTEARKQRRSLRVRPAALRCEPARRGVMVEGHHRGQSARAAAVDHRLVMIEHRDREQAGPWLDPWPFQAEAIAVEAKALHQVEIGAPQLEAVVGIARWWAERRLDILQHPLVAVGVVALHLMPRSRGTPEKAFGKSACGDARVRAAGQRRGGEERTTGGEQRTAIDGHRDSCCGAATSAMKARISSVIRVSAPPIWQARLK